MRLCHTILSAHHQPADIVTKALGSDPYFSVIEALYAQHTSSLKGDVSYYKSC